MKKRSYYISLLVIVFLFSIIPYKGIDAKVKLNRKKVTLHVGEKVKLKVKGTKKKVKWKSSKKKVATVTKKGIVKAKKKGTTIITAKVGKKKYKCKITVKKAYSYWDQYEFIDEAKYNKKAAEIIKSLIKVISDVRKISLNRSVPDHWDSRHYSSSVLSN